MTAFCDTKASLYQTPHRDPIQKLPTRLTVKTRAQVSLRINEQILRCCFKLLTRIIFTERGGENLEDVEKVKFKRHVSSIIIHYHNKHRSTCTPVSSIFY